MVSSKPVGIVTGGASGIGLAITKHLLSKGWRIVLADVNAQGGQQVAESLGSDTLFVQTDVSSWSSQLNLFKKAWDWAPGRLDFFAANAGIGDKEDTYKAWSDDEELKEPNLSALQVDLNAVFYGLKLFVYYVRRNPIEGGKRIGGRMVATSSMVGLYPMETNPQYAAAKHGVIGLVRSVGSKFLRDDGITVNAVLPAFVATGLAGDRVKQMPKEHVTPMSTIIKAYDSFLEDETLTGQAAECSQDQVFFRKQPEFPNESQQWLSEDRGGFWKSAYESRKGK